LAAQLEKSTSTVRRKRVLDVRIGGRVEVDLEQGRSSFQKPLRIDDQVLGPWSERISLEREGQRHPRQALGSRPPDLVQQKNDLCSSSSDL
jgi:hypothetical protein